MGVPQSPPLITPKWTAALVTAMRIGTDARLALDRQFAVEDMASGQKNQNLIMQDTLNIAALLGCSNVSGDGQQRQKEREGGRAS